MMQATRTKPVARTSAPYCPLPGFKEVQVTSTASFETTSSSLLGAFRALVRRIHAWRDHRAQRLAIAELLVMDPARLDDMGITADDIRRALDSGRSVGRVLNARRDERARDWSSEAGFIG